jgi:hypothetical protein
MVVPEEVGSTVDISSANPSKVRQLEPDQKNRPIFPFVEFLHFNSLQMHAHPGLEQYPWKPCLVNLSLSGLSDICNGGGFVRGG